MPASRRSEVSGGELLPLCVLSVLTVFSMVLPAFYAAVERPYPEALPAIESITWVSTVWAWLYAYTSRHRIRLPPDAGLLLFVAWWAVVPYYLFRVRGRGAWMPIGAAGFVWSAAYLLSRVAWMAAP